MDFALLFIRVIHIGLGTFWAGAMIFNAFFLFPAMRDAGPDGAKVAAGLMRRNFLQVVPVAAMFTLASGVYLLWRMSAGFAPAYLGTGPGIAYSTGMLAAVVAFLVGIGIVRPSMLKTNVLSQAVGSAAPADRERMMGEMQSLRARAGAAGQGVAWLLGTTVVAMAMARYL